MCGGGGGGAELVAGNCDGDIGDEDSRGHPLKSSKGNRPHPDSRSSCQKMTPQRVGKISPPEKSDNSLQQYLFIVGGGEHDTDHRFVGNNYGGNHIDNYNHALMKLPKRKRVVQQTCPRIPHTI